MDDGLKDILNLIMKYVDRADEHDIDETAIEQNLIDIENEIELLAMRIETGEFEKY